MTLAVSFRKHAQAEFDEATDRDEMQRIDLGQQFIAEVDRCLLSVSKRPFLYETAHGDIRRITLRRFPFNLYYRAETDRIVVLAVFHSSRDPMVWKGRN